jgi:hypothetical protein
MAQKCIQEGSRHLPNVDGISVKKPTPRAIISCMLSSMEMDVSSLPKVHRRRASVLESPSLARASTQ